MSSSLSVGIIAEGPTDHIVIRDIIQNLMGDKREVIFHQIQPEVSNTLALLQGSTGEGWAGVYRQIAFIRKYGDFQIMMNPLLALYPLDILIIHLDGDVSRETYENGHLSYVMDKNLPCKEIPCPLKQQHATPCVVQCSVPQQKVDQLQNVLYDWMGLSGKTKGIILCTPFDAIEAWVLAAFHPNDKLVQKKKLECQIKPANILGSVYHIKSMQDYKDKVQNRLKDSWHVARKHCVTAERFSTDFLADTQ